MTCYGINGNVTLFFYLLFQASEECTSVLELDHKHTGALMLRAQTLVTLKEYHSALFDVNRLIELNPSSEVYKNLQARLKSQLVVTPLSFILLLHLFLCSMLFNRYPAYSYFSCYGIAALKAWLPLILQYIFHVPDHCHCH